MKPERHETEPGGAERWVNQQQAASAAEMCDFDSSLLEDSLSKTTWERMQANDDALRLSDMLRSAMESQGAKPK